MIPSRVATVETLTAMPDANVCWFQSSLRDSGALPSPSRGLKPTAKFTSSLRDGTQLPPSLRCYATEHNAIKRGHAGW